MPADVADFALLCGLPPLIDPDTRVLVLGSFPSAASLAAQQYYAHPQNLFWRLLGEVTGKPLYEMPYAARRDAVLTAGIGIWDIYARCRRTGSLDSAIRDAELNDFGFLQKSTAAGRGVVGSRVGAGIRRVCFNGRTAARLRKAIAATGVEVVELPSTSPANAGIPYAVKLARWREAMTEGLV